jgi:hypothetical protein
MVVPATRMKSDRGPTIRIRRSSRPAERLAAAPALQQLGEGPARTPPTAALADRLLTRFGIWKASVKAGRAGGARSWQR